MTPRRRPRPSMLVAMIKRYRVAWAVLTMGLNALALALVVLVFPDVSNLWVSVFVLFGAFTASITTLAELLVSAEDSEREDVADGTVEPDAGSDDSSPAPDVGS